MTLQFNPKKLELLSAENLEALAKDGRIIRSMQKIVCQPQVEMSAGLICS